MTEFSWTQEERRAALDQEYGRRFAGRVRELFPHCPPEREELMAEHACLEHSGRIGRSAAAKSLDESTVRLAVIAHIRHAETTYDALGRAVRVDNPDGTYATTSYSGWATTAVDENGHQQRSTDDAFGRVVQVEEFTGEHPGATLYATTRYGYRCYCLSRDWSEPKVTRGRV